MTQQEAREKIAVALEKARDGKPADFTDDTDLVADKVIDSLEGMVFIEELAALTGKIFPDDLNLGKAGLFKVSKLIEYLLA